MRKLFSFLFIATFTLLASSCGEKVYRASEFGIVPNTGEDMTEAIANAIETITKERGGKPATLLLDSGEYDFYPDKAIVREYYISNHDQHNPKLVAVALEGLKNFRLDGNGSDFYMNGRMLPVSIVDCEGCSVENLHIDTRKPQITQVEILENDVDSGYIQYRIAPYANYKITDGNLVVYDTNWEFTPYWGIAFDGKTRHLVYRTSDIGVGTQNIEEIAPRVIRAPWKDARLVPGTVVAMRPYVRPTPGILLTSSKDTQLKNVIVH